MYTIRDWRWCAQKSKRSKGEEKKHRPYQSLCILILLMLIKMLRCKCPLGVIKFMCRLSKNSEKMVLNNRLLPFLFVVVAFVSLSLYSIYIYILYPETIDWKSKMNCSSFKWTSSVHKTFRLIARIYSHHSFNTSFHFISIVQRWISAHSLLSVRFCFFFGFSCLNNCHFIFVIANILITQYTQINMNGTYFRYSIFCICRYIYVCAIIRVN